MNFLASLAEALPQTPLLTGADCAPWVKDWTGAWTGEPMAVIRPSSTEEVSRIMQLAHAHGLIPLVPAPCHKYQYGYRKTLVNFSQCRNLIVIIMTRRWYLDMWAAPHANRSRVMTLRACSTPLFVPFCRLAAMARRQTAPREVRL